MAGTPSDRGPASWVGTWGASMTSGPTEAPVFHDQTLRQVVHTSAGGNRIRVRFSNAFGVQPLVIGAAHVASPLLGSVIEPASDRPLTFAGRSAATVSPADSLLSDPVDFNLDALSDVAVSIYLPVATPAGTVHWAARQTSYIAPGNRTGSTLMWPTSTIAFWAFITSIEITREETAAAIVTLGDSITDGVSAAVDGNRRWPDVLARRLLAKDHLHPVAVLNAGISGNRILHDGPGLPGLTFGPSALARFDRDVLAQPGVKYVIVIEGINDILQPGAGAPLSDDVTSGEIIAGLQQFVDRVHKKGLLILGGTLLPFEDLASDLFSQQREAKRQQVNQWIRTSRVFDAVIDFDRAVRDPARPARLLPHYDSGDHLHPSDAGYEAMANAIDLSLFSRSGGRLN
jgi:lysophospholipase L1-like esterase